MDRENRHRLSEERSLALHREVVRCVRDDPSLLAHARANVDRWLAQGTLAPAYAETWRRLLQGPLDALAAALVDDSERARALRQNTPFSFVLSPSARWLLWQKTRMDWEAGR